VVCRLCRLVPGFIAKGQVGRHFRAVSRNGKVLLASYLPAAELEGQVVLLRFTIWHRRLLAGDPPQPAGVLLGAWPAATAARKGEAPLEAELAAIPHPQGRLHLDLGGGRILSLLPPRSRGSLDEPEA
jgi:hypothetical protein